MRTHGGAQRGAFVTAVRQLAPLGWGLLVLLSSSVLAVWALYPAPPKRAVVDTEFSAFRAHATLARLLGDGRPHPVASDDNRAFRARLEQELRSLGLTPRVFGGMSCGRFGACAPVENVVAEIAGKRDGQRLAIVAHYDSVPASAGAADDGAGVATILEVARALRARGGPERPVTLLFTDGEEMGLLGAEQLARAAGGLESMTTFINLEGRGVRGPSLLFETSARNLELVRAVAAAEHRPVASSLFAAAYERLPNDTDLTVFLRHGTATGVNLAFIGDARKYHTAHDALDALSLASVDHQGRVALALTSTLVDRPTSTAAESAIFFDVLGRFLVVFSVRTAWAIAGLLAAATFLWIGVAVRRGGVSTRSLAFALVSWVAAIALSLTWAIVLQAAARSADAHGSPWPANAELLAVAVHLGALGSFLLAGFAVGVSIDVRATYLWTASWNVVLSFVLLWALPGAVYLTLVPGACLLVLALPTLHRQVRSRPGAHVWVTLLGVLPAALLWAPVDALAFEAIGTAALALTGALAAGLLTALSPLISALPPLLRLRAGTVAFVFAGVVGVLAVAMPSAGPRAPARINLAHYMDLESNRARWLTDASGLPKALASAAAFTPIGVKAELLWGLQSRHEAVAPIVEAVGPELEVLSTDATSPDRRTVELLLTPARSALAMTLALPAEDALSVEVDGVTATPLTWGGLALYTVVGPQRGGTRVRTVLNGQAPQRAQLVQFTRGLPLFARELERARDERATESQNGDLSIVSRKVDF